MNLSFDELKSSGVGKFITTLKSHVSGGIGDAASKLLQLWKSTMSGGNNSMRISTGGILSRKWLISISHYIQFFQ